MAVSKVHPAVLDKSLLIVLLRTEGADTRHYYFYLAVKPRMLKKLQRDVAIKNVQLTEYGMVLAYGEGEPDESVKNMITSNFGFDHEKIIELNW